MESSSFFITTTFKDQPSVSVHLPVPRDLSKYEVGVVQLDMPPGTFKLERPPFLSVKLTNDAPVVITVPPGNYDGVQEVLDIINNRLKPRVTFTHNGTVISVDGEENTVQLQMTDELAAGLGLPKMVQFHGRHATVHVHDPLLETQYVQLKTNFTAYPLATLPINRTVSLARGTIPYYPVLLGNTEELHMALYDHRGRAIAISGYGHVTLHFREKC
jgi:hypothetical protein